MWGKLAPPTAPQRAPVPCPGRTISSMSGTRRRGTRPDFKPGWEPFSLPEDEVLRRGGALFDGGMYWEAHEVWEEVWRMRKDGIDVERLSAALEAAIAACRAAMDGGPAPRIEMIKLDLGGAR